MSTEFNLSLFIFRRDLRLHDNTSLIKALERSETVIPVFIFDPSLLDPNNKSPNTNAIQFMFESLVEVDRELKSHNSHLYLFYGKPEVVVKYLLSEYNQIEAIFANKDYSPYAKKRERRLRQVCEGVNVEYFEYSDYLLSNPETIYTGSGNRYQVFTYFYRKARKSDVRPVQSNPSGNYYTEQLSEVNHELITKLMPSINPNLYVNGGRTHAMSILDSLSNFEDYAKSRDIPSQDGTTGLSAHNKFGTVSIREVYHKIENLFGADHDLIRQLYWRDFYSYLAIHFDHVFHQAFKKKYNRLNWENDLKKFERWCQGKTGFPIVDAGMRQLNTTGYMHNRIRMVVASFLVKDLHIDWKWGEQYFAEKLVDYDVMVNNGNWQWSASTGADAQPYFRIFNPWSQQKKYDKDALYIKEYISELKEIPATAIHKLHSQRPLGLDNYPLPMVDHKKRSTEAKSMFKQLS